MRDKIKNLIKLYWKRILIIGAFVILTIISLAIGALDVVNFKDLFAGNELSWKILWTSRVPRTLAIILSASGLSVAGLIMQSISRNKFMSPSTSGTTDAAALGVIIAFIALGDQPGIIQTIFAFLFALISTMAFMSVIKRLKIREIVYIPLIGIMYGGLIAAFTQILAYRFEALQMMQAIGLGGFAKIGSFATVYIIVVPLILSVIYSSRFSIIGMGEDFSKNLGLRYNRVVFVGLLLIALVSASSFVAVGQLPFIGLIIPNMTASFYGDNLKRSIIDVMFFGADFVLICDILSRVIIAPFEISVSLTISIIGGIIFVIYMIGGIRHGKQSQRAAQRK
ncbi:MAG: iron chelate uptake ABC transporter family permease subunit [Christensenellaceae bacterium]|jgi:iron complex transport system permease protein|nr:iron chelate uptake ABC transporter family permease subunit [Christensenellaceae bacterium]